MTNLCSRERLTEWEESDKPCERASSQRFPVSPPSVAHLFVLVYIPHSLIFASCFFPHLSRKPWPCYRDSSCSDPNLCPCLIRNPIPCLSDHPFSTFPLSTFAAKLLMCAKHPDQSGFRLSLLRRTLPSIFTLGKYAHILECITCALDLPDFIFIMCTTGCHKTWTLSFMECADIWRDLFCLLRYDYLSFTGYITARLQVSLLKMNHSLYWTTLEDLG